MKTGDGQEYNIARAHIRDVDVMRHRERERRSMGSAAPDDVQARAGSLLDKYQVPPFSVLDTRQGYWQEARRSWLALGIRSELGRGFNEDGGAPAAERTAVTSTLRAAMSLGETPERQAQNRQGLGALPVTGSAGASEYERQERSRQRAAATLLEPEWVTVSRQEADRHSNVTGQDDLPDYATFGMTKVAPGTSIFDPVLCELAYRWWCPPGGSILDPFAGGSVRGIVAAWLDHRYVGVDLSHAQVASNREQAAAIMDGRAEPEWIVGDSRLAVPSLGEEWADFVFTCPPYYDLEVYSDDPADLSRASTWADFLVGYGEIIGHSLAALKPGRFACFVVSEIRGRDGAFQGLVPWTIRLFEQHGARYYNEGILVNPAGTLPMRIGRQFDAGRKLGRSHQNILVFVKGDVPKTHEWGYEGTGAPPPQLEMFDLGGGTGTDGRPL